MSVLNANLQVNSSLRTIWIVLFLSVLGVMRSYAYYDFSAVCSTGQTLYYHITDVTNHFVEIKYPSYGADNPWYGFEKPSGRMVLPESVAHEGIVYKITRIGNYAFYDCQDLFGDLVIPNFVNEIGGCAFSGCSGFMGSLTLPNSVTEIGGCAFSGCSGFTGSLTLPNSVTYLGYGAFSGCSGFTGSLTLGNSVDWIQEDVFLGCSGFTGSLIIPNTVIRIDVSAFSGCSGFSGALTIPSSVNLIGKSAFLGCSGFSKVHYDAINCFVIDHSYQSLFFPFECCGGELVIGENVEMIPSNMFRNAAFTGSLTIPNSVTEIGEFAFAGCSGFTGSLIIPNSVTVIGEWAFYGCGGFSEVFYDANLSNSYLPFEGCGGELIIGENVEMIPPNMFRNAAFSGSLIIPNSVTEIGEFAFAGCSGFTGPLIIPILVTSIGRRAFENCSGLKNLTIGNSVSEIGEDAFKNCSGLTSVEYNANKCSLMEDGLSNCPITIVYLGKNVISIPEGAFQNCRTLNTIISYGTMSPSLGANAFVNIDPLAALFVPCGSQMSYYHIWGTLFSYDNIHENCVAQLVTIDPTISGGIVTPSVSEAIAGETIVLDVRPNSGYELRSLLVYNVNDVSQIVSVNTANNSFVMPSFEVMVSAVFVYTSVNENTDNYIAIYPNPTLNRVKIEAENLRHISVFNIIGQQIYTSQADGNEFEFDFGKQDVGIYLIRIETTNGVATKRVVLTR